MPQIKRLLVEGPNDKFFFEALLRKHRLEKIITTSPAKELGGFNTKQGAINLLSSLVQNLIDGHTERLGLILDSDTVKNGGGLDLTLTQIADKVVPFGYERKPIRGKHGGFLFLSTDGLPAIGTWVMPNNKDEGTIEHWVSKLVNAQQKPLFTDACTAVDKISTPLFPPIRKPKAEVATWLAWQEIPGKGLDYTISGDMLDDSAPLYSDLINWMHQVFL